jgi:predicted nucleotide-binding protein (sugar kinase/HSP70/actin superfamily)
MNDQTSQRKTIYLPYMCDHIYALAAALQAHHMPTKVLSPPNQESLSIGLDAGRGRECLPCLYMIGDIICQIRKPDFEPSKSVFLMPTGQGPCRFGQYLTFQRELARQQGFGEIEFASPAGENSYQGFGDDPTALRMLVWQGLVAVDLLQKLLHEYRPYELEKGKTDKVYQLCLQLIVKAVRANEKHSLPDAMNKIARCFESLAIDRDEPRPLIGVVGEIYMRVNPNVNQEIIRQVEAAGGEVVLATVLEWLYFTNWCYQTLTWELGSYWESLKMYLTDFQQTRLEHKLAKPLAHLLRNPYETPVKKVLGELQPIFDPLLGLEAVFTLGKGMDMAESGVSGILNIMPFNCMSGIISAGMASSLRNKLNHIPWLDVIYDGQGRTNLNTRLEAFMYQVRNYWEQEISNTGPSSEFTATKYH